MESRRLHREPSGRAGLVPEQVWVWRLFPILLVDRKEHRAPCQQLTTGFEERQCTVPFDPPNSPTDCGHLRHAPDSNREVPGDVEADNKWP
ncbi:hypothetical protein EYF80_021149 [Liparis tanakae]|uniref:Uncharacterized protein n=1 Tax=Liparis tanakae TaxID=230148 RepID=A0A4Z2HTJ5_9TELE|nr:hypothetical protein EYF80_021149 [Liparis tanakae]